MNIFNVADIKSTIKRRRALKCDFKNYKIISKQYKIYNKEWYFPNNFYGISNNFYSYSKYNIPIKACIEHGMVLGNNASKFEIYNPILHSIITLSDYRKKYLELVSDKIIFKVGPYIHYATDFYNNEQINEEKIKKGKTLLVFPSHSIEDINATYNVDEFIKEIKKISKLYNTKNITICIYWNDINRGLHKIYEKHGFNIVTAGYREDPMFLSRLKSIIKLSDYTMSNNFGTHIGYCIYLKKPHYIMKQKVEYKINRYIKHNQKSNKAHVVEFENIDISSYEEEVNIVLKNFGKPVFEISKNQQEICNKYWGFDEIKSPNQIRNIIEFCEYLFQEVCNKNEKMEIALRNYLINNKTDENIRLTVEEQLTKYNI